MKTLFLFALLLSACSSPPKVISKPEVGMDLATFHDLCGVDADDSKTQTTEKGEMLTLKNNPTNYNRDPHMVSCVGTFTFVNGKLTTIEH